MCVSDGGCVWVVAVVCGSWWLCVGCAGCVWVVVVVSVWVNGGDVAVVCGSWRLCVGRGGCVCELRDVSKDAIICQ